MQDIPSDESHMYFLLQPLRQLGIRRLLFQYKVDLKFEKKIAVGRFNVILLKD